MFWEWYRKREKSDERKENFDKILRGERRIPTKERAAGERIARGYGQRGIRNS